MAARKVGYVDLKVPRRAGEGARILGALRKARVSLLAFTGFPDAAGKAQIDLVSDDIGAVRRVAQQEGWSLGPTKKGFLVQGRDRGRYGMILWVKPGDYTRAARVLRAR
jgi:hypothetical protein